MTGIHWLWWSVALGVAGALAIWAFVGDRARGRPRCPKCWYDMQGAAGARCPECGFEAKSPRQWQRSKRRAKTAVVALFAMTLIGVFPFWRGLLRSTAFCLPNTVLVILLARIEESEIEQEIWSRVADGDGLFVSSWRRSALWGWQWKLVADRARSTSNRSLRDLGDAAAMFAQPFPPDAFRLGPEAILRVANDPTGREFKMLRERLQLPGGEIPTFQWDSLSVASVEIHDAENNEARIFLVSGFQNFEIFALQKRDEHWEFAGHVNVHSKYADPVLGVLEQDPTICELGGLSTGGTGVWSAAMAWLRVNDDGLRVIHHWPTGGHEYFSRSPYAYEYREDASKRAIGSDRRGRYVDHILSFTVSNDGILWMDSELDANDVAAVADLGDVFTRTGRARYRWSKRQGEYVFSPSESDWTHAQAAGDLPADHETFITQNFHTLVELATGIDPARRAWVRLILTRLDDCDAKDRLIEAIDQ